MKKRGRKRIWSLLIILLVLVAAGLAAYFLFQEKERGERKGEERKTEERTAKEEKAEEKRAPVEEPAPIQKEGAPQVAAKTPAKGEPPLTEGFKEGRPSEKEDYCSKVENSVLDFFTYINKERYVRNLEADMDSYERFKRVMMKLSSEPPVPAGENMDTLIMTRNIYHFYRLLENEDLRLIREIMRNEADSLELNMDIFYRWLMLGDQCPDPKKTRPSLDVLYQYAGFFLNTIGGRAYLYRRPLNVRLLISYYALLIVHEADKTGKNSYGIDVFPEITPLAREISLYPDFHFQNEYILQLTQLQNYYLKRR
ncbi:MAG: hypothetical protein JSW56_03370 [Deltaproteobacteria bacterium]|nr:MAG: hypothetical protein JSW56_03370 [Deltaproteobacteria bacterium]